MENQEWKIKLTWNKAHAGHHGKDLADQTAKEAATNSDIVYYRRIPKCRVRRELRENGVIKWQGEWENTRKGANTKLFFPKIADRLQLKINVTVNFTTMVTGQGNIKSYLYRFKIQDGQMCSCKRGEQTRDHILCNCE